MRLDPRTHAIRSDLADVRLADRVFAPHYAEAIERRVVQATPLRVGREASSEIVHMLQPGDRFDLLDLIGEDAWGSASDARLAGWLPAASLAA